MLNSLNRGQATMIWGQGSSTKPRLPRHCITLERALSQMPQYWLAYCGCQDQTTMISALIITEGCTDFFDTTWKIFTHKWRAKSSNYGDGFQKHRLSDIGNSSALMHLSSKHFTLFLSSWTGHLVPCYIANTHRWAPKRNCFRTYIKWTLV